MATDEKLTSGVRERLDSWKRVAAYLQRGVRTVRRWEAEEGLPVHRHPHKRQGSIYAYKHEIDAWLDARSSRQATKPGRVPLLAVLPFANLSDDPGQEFFSDGLTEELIACLGHSGRERLGVIARTSAMVYKNTSKSIAEIGAELGVDFIIEGSVRKEDRRIRTTAQLIRVNGQVHEWARIYDEPLASVLEVQCRLADEIAREVDSRLTDNPRSVPRRATKARPVEQGAYEAYLMGRYQLYQLSPVSIASAVASFSRAIEIDPKFAAAYAARAEALQFVSIFGGPPATEIMPQALESVTRALSLDADSAESYAALGLIHTCYTWDWAAAEGAFERAVALNPSLAIAHQWRAEFLAAMQRFDEALASIALARELDPLSLAIDASRAHVFWLARDGDELVRIARRILEMEPRYVLAHILHICGLEVLGRYEEALESARRADEACGPVVHIVAFIAYFAGLSGQRELAESLLEQMKQQAVEGRVVPTALAYACIGIGRIDEALDHMEAAQAERYWLMSTMQSASSFDRLRGEPRFERLLENMRFPATAHRLV